MNDLFDRLHKGRKACVQHNHGDDHRAQVFDAPVTKRMLFIRFLSRQLRANDRDQGASGIGDVVDCVKHDRDGVGHQADHSLEAGKKYIGDYSDNACPDDCFLAG